MNCPTCTKPLTPIGKTGRKWRCTNPNCDEIKVEVQSSTPNKGEAVTEIAGQSNSLSEGGDAMKR
jgi:hypothetical protein